jgi:hypothetical protein
MQGKLTDADGQTVEASLDAVRERLSGEAFFWLDLEGLDADSSELLLIPSGVDPLLDRRRAGRHLTLLTGHVLTQTWSFWVLGIGLDLAAAVGLLYLFPRRGWLGGPTE